MTFFFGGGKARPLALPRQLSSTKAGRQSPTKVGRKTRRQVRGNAQRVRSAGFEPRWSRSDTFQLFADVNRHCIESKRFRDPKYFSMSYASMPATACGTRKGSFTTAQTGAMKAHGPSTSSARLGFRPTDARLHFLLKRGFGFGITLFHRRFAT